MPLKHGGDTRPRDPEVRDCSYNVGEALWLREKEPRPKRAPRWIVKRSVDLVLGPASIRIINDAGHTKVVYVDKIKLGLFDRVAVRHRLPLAREMIHKRTVHQIGFRSSRHSTLQTTRRM